MSNFELDNSLYSNYVENLFNPFVVNNTAIKY